ncbi:MAG: type II toxin-antitoxin system HicA family toxin [Ardenticatenaceae bacterium]|nr:type II toxin-antitoxin system HicA family toxin [Ardenticatenaceae bacterium]
MSPRLQRVKPRALVRALEKAGFVQQAQRGSHLRLWREADHCLVIVPLHQGRDIPTGTLRSILRDAHISPDEFAALLQK